MNKKGNFSLRGVRNDSAFTTLMYEAVKPEKGEVIAELAQNDSKVCTELAKDGCWVLNIDSNELGDERQVWPLPDASVGTLFVNMLELSEQGWQTLIHDASRVVKRRLVLFAYDQRVGSKSWLSEYFPDLWKEWHSAFPDYMRLVNELETCFEIRSESYPYHVSHNCQLPLNEAGWRNPHLYIYPRFRNQLPLFKAAEVGAVGDSLLALEEDLDSGRWEVKYGDLLSMHQFDSGYRFVVVDRIDGQPLQYAKTA